MAVSRFREDYLGHYPAEEAAAALKDEADLTAEIADEPGFPV